MAIMTDAKFHFNWLMLTLIFGIWASEPPRPGERVKRPGLIGLKENFKFVILQSKQNKPKVVPIIKCTCTVFIDNFRNISTKPLK